MSNKQYVCSVCGKLGHNKRTCGKTAPTRPVHPHRTPPPQAEPAGVDEAGTLADAIRILGGDPQTVEPSAVLPNPTPVTVAEEPPTATQEPVVETMTAEDIETWWMLTSGKTGKRHIEKKKVYGFTRKVTVVNWDKEDTTKLLGMLDIAVEQGTSARALKKFLNFFGAAAKKNLANDKRTKPAVLLVLAKDSSTNVKKILAQRNNLPENIVNVLASDNEYDVRLAVATRDDLSPATIETIYREYPSKKQPSYARERRFNGSLKGKLAQHKNLPAWIRKELLASGVHSVVRKTLTNPNTTAEELLQTWQEYADEDSYFFVTEKILAHPNTPAKILDSFLEKQIIMGNHAAPHGAYSTILQTACSNPNVSAATLDKVAKQIILSDREKIFRHSQIPYAIVHNPSTADSTLEWITDNYPSLAANIASATLTNRHTSGKTVPLP